jgi:hypothetical protein
MARGGKSVGRVLASVFCLQEGAKRTKSSHDAPFVAGRPGLSSVALAPLSLDNALLSKDNALLGCNPKRRKNLAKQSANAKPHALTFNFVILRAAGPWQSRRPFRLLCPSRKLNRRMDCHVATRLAMTGLEVICTSFPPLWITPCSVVHGLYSVVHGLYSIVQGLCPVEMSLRRVEIALRSVEKPPRHLERPQLHVNIPRRLQFTRHSSLRG